MGLELRLSQPYDLTFCPRPATSYLPTNHTPLHYRKIEDLRQQMTQTVTDLIQYMNLKLCSEQ